MMKVNREKKGTSALAWGRGRRIRKVFLIETFPSNKNGTPFTKINFHFLNYCN